MIGLIQKQNIIVDTIKVRFPNPEIERNDNIRVYPAPEGESGYLLFSMPDPSNYTGEGSTFGQSAFYDDDTYKIKMSRYGAFLQFNPTKIFNREHNAKPITKANATRVVESIKEHLNKNGFLSDLWKAKLSRVDLALDIETNHPYSTYEALFRVLHGKRASKYKFYSTYYFGSKQRTIAIYDKISELKHLGIDVSDLPENLMRIEYRMLNARRCKQDLLYSELDPILGNPPSDDLSHLLNIWYSLPTVYKKNVREMLFNLDDILLNDAISNGEEEVFGWYKRRYPKNSFQKYLEARGYQKILDKVGDEDDFRHMLRSHMGSAVLYRNMKKFKESLARAPKTIDREISVAELYDELYSKIMAI